MNVLKVIKTGTKKLSDLFEDKEESKKIVIEERPQEINKELNKEVEMKQEEPKPVIKNEETESADFFRHRKSERHCSFYQ